MHLANVELQRASATCYVHIASFAAVPRHAITVTGKCEVSFKLIVTTKFENTTYMIPLSTLSLAISAATY